MNGNNEPDTETHSRFTCTADTADTTDGAPALYK